MTAPLDSQALQEQMHPARITLRLLPFVLMVFLGFLTIGVPLPVLPLHVHGVLGFGTVLAGLVVGIQSLATVLTRGYAGTTTDLRGARRAVLGGLAACLLAGGTYLASVLLMRWPVASLVVLIAGRLVLGVGESQLLTGGLTWAIGTVGPRHAGRVMALNGIAMYAALAAGAPIGLALNAAFGFAAVAVAVILLPIAAALLAMVLPPVPPSGGRRIPFHRVIGLIWRQGMSLALATAGFGVIATFLSLAFASRGWSGAGLSLAAFGGAYILVRIPFSGLPDRIGGRPVALVSMLIEAGGLLILCVAASPVQALAGAAVTGAGFSLVFPALGILAIRRVPPENRGLGLGAYAAFFDVAMGVTGPVAGAIAAGFGYAAVFLTGAAAALLSFALLLATGRE
jgi:predicted MFS family arabinose efflux permease